MKKRICNWIGAAGAVGALALVLPLLAADNENKDKEETVNFKDCPAAVQKAILDNANGGKILEVEKETTKDGKVIYEAEVKKADGKKTDVKVTEEGKLIGGEDEDEADEDADEGEDED